MVKKKVIPDCHINCIFTSTAHESRLWSVLAKEQWASHPRATSLWQFVASNSCRSTSNQAIKQHVSLSFRNWKSSPGYEMFKEVIDCIINAFSSPAWSSDVAWKGCQRAQTWLQGAWSPHQLIWFWQVIKWKESECTTHQYPNIEVEVRWHLSGTLGEGLLPLRVCPGFALMQWKQQLAM